MASLGDGCVRAGGDPRGGRVYQSRSGAWHAWRRGVGGLGAFPSRPAAVAAVGKAKPPKRRRNGAAELDQPQLAGVGGDPLVGRLIGDESNRFVLDAGGRKLGAIITTRDGRRLGFTRLAKLGEYPTPDDTARAVIQATRLKPP